MYKPSKLIRFLKIVMDIAWYGQLVVLVGLFFAALYYIIKSNDPEWTLPMKIQVGVPVNVSIDNLEDHFPSHLKLKNGNELPIQKFEGNGRFSLENSSEIREVLSRVALPMILYLLSGIFIIYTLRELMRNAARGFFFTRTNTMHLRRLAWLIIGCALLEWLMLILIEFQYSIQVPTGVEVGRWEDKNQFFLGLMVLVLAEVFHAGTRMEEDQALTI